MLQRFYRTFLHKTFIFSILYAIIFITAVLEAFVNIFLKNKEENHFINYHYVLSKLNIFNDFQKLHYLNEHVRHKIICNIFNFS